MPNNYDNVTFTQGWVKTNGVTTYTQYRTGGGKRNWAGNQSRIKPAFPTATFISANSTRYFNTLHSYKLGNSEYYRPLSAHYGSYLEYSDDDADGAGFARNRAIMNLQRGHLNVLVSAGEGKETVTFVANRIFMLYRLLRLISRGKFEEAARVAGSDLSQNAGKRLRRNRSQYRNPIDLVSNSWLEYQFAIRPIVNDVYGAVEAFHDNLQAGRVVRAYGKYSSGEKGTVYRAGIVGVVRSENVRTLQQLGFTNPALAAWNLLPLSFILDWFLPIAPLLSYLDSTVGFGQTTSWESVRKWVAKRAKDPANSLEEVTEYYNRVAGSLLAPALVIGGNLNTSQVTTASALLQRFSR